MDFTHYQTDRWTSHITELTEAEHGNIQDTEKWANGYLEKIGFDAAKNGTRESPTVFSHVAAVDSLLTLSNQTCGAQPHFRSSKK